MVYNAAAIIEKGALTLRFKSDLPNYGVFDEKRVFAPGPVPEPVQICGTRAGVPICEDIWTPAITSHLTRAGAELFDGRHRNLHYIPHADRIIRRRLFLRTYSPKAGQFV